jgi:Tol biopolymer transport system component
VDFALANQPAAGSALVVEIGRVHYRMRQTLGMRLASLLLSGLVVLAGCGGASRPVLQLDAVGGQQIAFASDSDGDWEIFTMRPDGSQLRRLTNNGAYDWAPTWSTDGSRIAFTSNFLEGKTQTVKSEVNGKEVWTEIEVVGDQEIWLFDLAGWDSEPITDNSIALEGGTAWSPDGSRIAFHSDLDESGVFEIYSMKPNGTDQLKLTDLGGTSWDPSWSPDGQHIVFASLSGIWGMYIVGADGTGLRSLESAGEGWKPSWSPSGDQIAFASNRDGNWNLYVMEPDGTNVVNITHNEGNSSEPTWSPTGDQIAFASDRGGKMEIFIMDADGDNVFATGQSGFPSDWVDIP